MCAGRPDILGAVNTAPACPRCGYDLSGAAPADDGVCAECGLRFPWRDVLAMAEHPWLFEYHWRRGPLRRLVLTWFAAIRAGRFWKDVRLTDPVHLRPLALIVAGLFALMLAGGYGMILGLMGGLRFRSPMRFPWQRRGVEVLIDSLVELITSLWQLVPGVLVALAVMPFAFMLLPQTLGRARVRRAHVARMWLYSLMLPLTVLAAWAVGLAVLIGVGEDGIAAFFNPWEWADTITDRSHLLFWLRYSLPGIALSTLITAWIGWWTLCACRHYLRLEQPGRVAAALTAIVFLAAMAAQFWAAVS